MNKVYVFLAIACALVGLASSHAISNRKCSSRRESNTLSEVHEVKVEPCTDADGESTPCELQRGISANLTVTFTPRLKHKRMKASIVWASGSIDLPFRGLPSNACRSLTEGGCPTTPNQTMVWSAAIPILTSFPTNTYPLKLRIMDGSKFVVCQQIKIKLV